MKMLRYCVVYCLLLVQFCDFACEVACGQTKTVIRLHDVTAEAGIDFVHSDGSSGRRYIVESVTAGMALLDYDADGFSDVYFLNGAALPGTGISTRLTNRLYRNNGDWTFTDVTHQAGVGDDGYSLGVAVADYDQDGDSDIYVTNFGANVFYVNNGDGTFGEATNFAGLACDRFGAGAAFADFDCDGDVDLYCANYQKFSLDQHRIRMIGSHQFHPGPQDYPPEYDRLFDNLGDGTFLDISQESGIARVASTGMGVLASDVDGDGDMDIFVANDSRPNFLWMNDGSGQFTEEAVLAGVAYDRAGNANGNMGVEPLDYNADGLVDFFTTTYQDEMPVLYQNLGGFFQDVTRIVGIDNGLLPHVNWGIGSQDFDNDGDTDLLIACGHFMDNIQFIDDRTQVKVGNYLLENRSGKFFDMTSQVGSGLAVVESSRSAGFEDLDHDGDMDGVIMNFQARPTVLRNESLGAAHWIAIRTVGTLDNRDGIGAFVRVAYQGQTQVAEVYAGRGYQSSYGSQLHFGLGTADAVDYIEVRWPNQVVERFTGEIDRTIVLVQGSTQRFGSDKD